MKKFVALSMIAAVSLGLSACKKAEEAPVTNDLAANATEAEAIEDINAATENVADAGNAAVDTAAAVDNAVADNAANAM